MINQLKLAKIELNPIQANGEGRADILIPILLQNDQDRKQALDWLRINRSEIKLKNGKTAIIKWNQIALIENRDHGWGVAYPLYTKAFGRWSC